MSGDNQANEANKFARQHFGGEVDAAAGAAGFKVLTDGEGEGGPPKIPWVELPGHGNRDVADFARDLGAVLAECPIFRREDVVVTVEPTTGQVKPMSPEHFCTWVTDFAVVYEKCQIGRGEKSSTLNLRRTMPLTTAKITLVAGQFYRQIRPLVRVNAVRMPVMRASGRPELLPEGYDAEAQIFTLTSGVAIDETMPLKKAVALLEDYYSEFAFTDARSKAVAIAEPLALWAIALQAVEAARMGFMNRANTQGGGKSLIAQMGITPSYGLPENTAKAKEEELRKQLDAAVVEGVPYLFFDNLKGHFENSLIEGFMTTPVWRARVMGTQRFMRGKVCCVLLITGNNLTVSPDMQRRLLQCDVFVEEFDLQAKSHRRVLNPRVLNRPEVRGEFLSALLQRGLPAGGHSGEAVPSGDVRGVVGYLRRDRAGGGFRESAVAAGGRVGGSAAAAAPEGADRAAGVRPGEQYRGEQGGRREVSVEEVHLSGNRRMLRGERAVHLEDQGQAAGAGGQGVVRNHLRVGLRDGPDADQRDGRRAREAADIHAAGWEARGLREGRRGAAEAVHADVRGPGGGVGWACGRTGRARELVCVGL
jgi:hypothetical protein